MQTVRACLEGHKENIAEVHANSATYFKILMLWRYYIA
jgi:hypothetical protein